MKPIRVKLSTVVQVPLDYTNPKHEQFINIGIDYAEEIVYVDGVFTERIEYKVKYSDGAEITKYSAVFWEDMGSYYRYREEDPMSFIIMPNEINRIINAAYNV